MDVSIGIQGKGYALVASDRNAARSIVKMKADLDKNSIVGSHQVIAVNGEAGDTVQFAEYVTANLKLNAIRNNRDTSPAAAASWIRHTIATSLRSKKPYQVNLLLAGYDTARNTSHLYWMDYLGTKVEVPYACHGYASYFCLSLLDKYHDPEAGWEEAMEILKRCIDELQKRMIVDLGSWNVKIVTAEGVKEIILGGPPAPAGAKPPSETNMPEAAMPIETSPTAPIPA